MSGVGVGAGAGAGATETIRLEEYTGIIQNRLVCAWQAADSATPWLPTEFLLSQYITRILVTGRASPMSVALAADPSWTQVWRSPGGKEWSCMLGVLQHMPGPILIVVGPDLTLSAKLVSTLRAACKDPGATVVVLRQTLGWATGGAEAADQVFFPVMDGGARSGATVTAAMQEWAGRAAPRHLDLKTLLPQLAAQGYGLTVAEGLWQWYRPADSPPLASLTVAQIARQMQILSAVLERAAL